MNVTVKPPLPTSAFKGKHVLLASNSPRRHELLGLIVPEFEVLRLQGVKETYPSEMKPEEVPAYLSRLKADACKDVIGPDDVVITADTVVIIDGNILGKPRGYDDAVEMLKTLRGRTHRVVTGVTITCAGGSDTFSATTDVTFGELTDGEIEEYVALYQPYDKAGAYGIQEWIGAIGIEGMNGSFYNVMGLPVKLLYDHLKALRF